MKKWPCDPDGLQPIPEESISDLYIHPGTDVFQQPSHNPSILHENITHMDVARQNNEDARRNDIIQAASSSSQVRDCRSVLSIPRRTESVDDDSSSD